MKTKNLTLAILMSLVVMGCSKNETVDKPSSFPADGIIRVATTVTDPKTRAGMTTANLSDMGFYVENSNSATYTYKNVKMTYELDKWNSEKVMLWQNSTQAVNIKAYSPYIKDITDITVIPFSVQTDQRTEENIKASDFVYDEWTNFVPAEKLKDGCVPLALNHVLSKLVVTIKLGTEFNETPGTATNPIEDVTVNGTKITGTLDFMNNAMKPEALKGDPTPILMYQESYTPGEDATSNATAEYQCILLPQIVPTNTFTIDILIPGKGNYKYTLATEQLFEVKMLYTLTLTVGKDRVTAGNMTMSDWVPGNGNGDNYETE